MSLGFSYDLNGNVLTASRKSTDVLSRSAALSGSVASYDGNRISRLSGEEDSSAPSEERMRKNGIDRGGVCAGVINTSSGTLEQFTDYDPYGMPHVDAIGADKSRRKFVSKELTTEYGIDLYDFEQRFLNLDIPCFLSPDRLAYETPHITPYSYCHGDPINYIDPTGLYRTQEEAILNGGSLAEGAEILFDEHRGEWYIALDWTGMKPYSGQGSVTRYYGDDKRILEAFDKAAPAILTGNSVCFGVQDYLINMVARETLDAATNKALNDTRAVTKALGKEIGAYYKVVKFVGRAATVVGVGMAAYDAYTYGMNGGQNNKVYVKYACDALASSIGSSGFGLIVSVLYMYADYATDGFYIDYSIPEKETMKRR